MHVVVADEYQLIVDGFTVLLGEIDPGVRVLPARDAASALAAAREAGCVDLAIQALYMRGMEGLHGLDDFLSEFPDCPIVIIADGFSNNDVFECMRRGASGFVPKSFTKSAIVGALKLVLEGHKFIPATSVMPENAERADGVIAPRVFGSAGPYSRLTPKERLVLQELLTGSSNREIGCQLGLQEATVKFHLRRIFRKLGTKNRGETIRTALLSNW